MKNLQKAWMFSIGLTIIALFFNRFPEIIIIVFIAHLLIVGQFIGKDVTSKGKSNMHQLWAWLGPIGVAIYHFTFSKKN